MACHRAAAHAAVQTHAYTSHGMLPAAQYACTALPRVLPTLHRMSGAHVAQAASAGSEDTGVFSFPAPGDKTRPSSAGEQKHKSKPRRNSAQNGTKRRPAHDGAKRIILVPSALIWDDETNRVLIAQRPRGKRFSGVALTCCAGKQLQCTFSTLQVCER